MEQPKCPECGGKITALSRKCRNCGAELVICSECGSVYPKGTPVCDMCGKELKRRILKFTKKRKAPDASAPNDLVSIINDIKKRSIWYKLLRIVKWLAAILFCIILALSIPIGLLIGEAAPDLTVSIIYGNSFSELLEQIVTTVPRNIELWKNLFRSLASDAITVSETLSFLNYAIASLGLPMLVVTAYYALVYVPLDILNTLLCGILARKRGYNSSDTVAVFECPSLIYNSADSFDKAYTYFPFTEKLKGKIGSVAADLIFYIANLSYCILGLAVFAIQAVSKVAIWVIFGRAIGLSALTAILTAVVLASLLSYIAIVVAICIVASVSVNAIRRKQLKNWSKI